MVQKQYGTLLIPTKCGIIGFFVVLLFLALYRISTLANYICVSSNEWMKIEKVCANYRNDFVNGILCPELCSLEMANNIRCITIGNQQAVLGKTKDDVYKIIQFAEEAPSKDNRQISNNLLRDTIKLKYNQTLNDDELKIIFQTVLKPRTPIDDLSWKYLHTKGFILPKLYRNEQLFPTVYGTCGPVYAVEYLQPYYIFKPFSIIVPPKSQCHLFIERMQFYFTLLTYIHSLSTNNLSMCDVDEIYFGTGLIRNYSKYFNLEDIYATPMVDQYLSGGRPCVIDSDCTLKKCRGICDPITSTCRSVQQNNNLQVLCENILYKSYDSKFITENFKSLLDKCVNPKTSDQHEEGRIHAPNSMIFSNLILEVWRYIHSKH